MAEIVITPRAEEELGAIWLAIAPDNPRAADGVVREIFRKIELLRSQPRIGVRRTDIRPKARMLVHAPYLILYETHPDSDDGNIDTVEVVTVIDGRRDLSDI